MSDWSINTFHIRINVCYKYSPVNFINLNLYSSISTKQYILNFPIVTLSSAMSHHHMGVHLVIGIILCVCWFLLSQSLALAFVYKLQVHLRFVWQFGFHNTKPRDKPRKSIFHREILRRHHLGTLQEPEIKLNEKSRLFGVSSGGEIGMNSRRNQGEIEVTFAKAATVSTSRWLVGSSRIRRCGFIIAKQANATRDFWPPDKTIIFLVARSLTQPNRPKIRLNC